MCCTFYIKIEEEFGTVTTQPQYSTRKHIDRHKTPHNPPTYDLDDEAPHLTQRLRPPPTPQQLAVEVHHNHLPHRPPKTNVPKMETSPPNIALHTFLLSLMETGITVWQPPT
jgi:hypothetical protein